MKKLKRLRIRILNKLGITFVLCKFRDGENTITVKSNGWVIISDGQSHDAIPLIYCSKDLAERAIKEAGLGAN